MAEPLDRFPLPTPCLPPPSPLRMPNYPQHHSKYKCLNMTEKVNSLLSLTAEILSLLGPDSSWALAELHRVRLGLSSFGDDLAPYSRIRSRSASLVPLGEYFRGLGDSFWWSPSSTSWMSAVEFLSAWPSEIFLLTLAWPLSTDRSFYRDVSHPRWLQCRRSDSGACRAFGSLLRMRGIGGWRLLSRVLQNLVVEKLSGCFLDILEIEQIKLLSRTRKKFPERFRPILIL